MINEQTVKDIEGAILAIKERGWAQGFFVEPGTGKVCVMGAMRLSIFGSPYPSMGQESIERWDRLYAAKSLLREVVDMSPEWFNDRKGTKRHHVLKALEKAARQASKGT